MPEKDALTLHESMKARDDLRQDLRNGYSSKTGKTKRQGSLRNWHNIRTTPLKKEKLRTHQSLNHHAKLRSKNPIPFLEKLMKFF